jgi:hypothetical protein
MCWLMKMMSDTVRSQLLRDKISGRYFSATVVGRHP